MYDSRHAQLSRTSEAMSLSATSSESKAAFQSFIALMQAVADH